MHHAAMFGCNVLNLIGNLHASCQVDPIRANGCKEIGIQNFELPFCCQSSLEIGDTYDFGLEPILSDSWVSIAILIKFRCFET